MLLGSLLRRLRGAAAPPPCLVCGGSSFAPDGSIEAAGDTFAYLICSGCGLQMMFPRPSKRWYRRFYEGEFWHEKHQATAKHGSAEEAFAARKRRAMAKARYHADTILRHIELGPESRTLDVGCGYGFLSRFLRERTGCLTDGVEPGEQSWRVMMENGVRLAGQSIESFKGEPGSYDVVSFASSLINLADPAAALAAVRPLIAPGGILYVQVNNPIYRGGMSIYHPVIFHPANLEFLLRCLGYEIVGRDYDGDLEEEPEPFRWWLTLIARPSDAPRPAAIDFAFDLQRFRRARELGQRRQRELYKDKARIKALAAEHPII
jgi:SAM-dependent methyltransferase